MSLLNRKVLVLNKSWTAIAVISLRRAITLLFKECAIIIDPTQDFQTFTWKDWSKIRPQNHEESIASANIVFRVPEVILLKGYNKLPAQNVHFNRRALYKRDSYSCCYCGAQPGTEELSIDHIVPRSLGGKSEWTNCVIACVKCNLKKANKTLEQAGMKLLKKPIKPKFNLFKEDLRIESWSAFLSEAYWNATLKE